MKHASILLLLLLGALLQAACSNQAVYTGESFASDSPFRMRAEGEVAMACESARRALLGQGYLIESAGSDSVKARKAYKTEDTQNTFIEMNIACLHDSSGSTLYATGVLTTYALKKSTSSASVGLSALGSISLPIGQSADSLVKVGEETIDDKDFYKRFFSAVDIILGEMRASEETTVPVAPEPGPAPVPSTVVPAAIQTTPAAVAQPAPASVTTPTSAPVAVPAAAPVSTPADNVPLQAAPVATPPPVPAPAATGTQIAPAPTVPDAVGEPIATPTAPVTAAPADAPAAPPAAKEPTPTLELPEPGAVQTKPTTVLEEFAAPRDKPF